MATKSLVSTFVDHFMTTINIVLKTHIICNIAHTYLVSIHSDIDVDWHICEIELSLEPCKTSFGFPSV